MDPAVANAEWWTWFWGLIGAVASWGVFIAIGLEVWAHGRESRQRKIIEDATAREIAQTNERAASFERDAAALNLELAKLKTDRHLTDEQKAQLKDDIKAIGEKHLVRLYAPNSDNETKGFMIDWGEALRDAGWAAPMDTPLSVEGGPMLPGVCIIFKRRTLLPSWQLQFLNTAKKYAPDLVIGGYDELLDDDAVKLLFGPKPINEDWRKQTRPIAPHEAPQFVPPDEERHLPGPPEPPPENEDSGEK